MLSSSKAQLLSTIKNFHQIKSIGKRLLASDTSSTTTTASASKFDRYLVKTFSNTKYKTLEDVPNTLPVATINYCRDKARTRASLVLILLTFFAAYLTTELAKYRKRHGHKSYNAEEMRENK